MSFTTHLAAVLDSKGAPFNITQRPTPKPGPNDLLIEVKSLAINPIDNYMREAGWLLWPSSGPQVGARVLAFAPCFYTGGEPNYGAFQEKVLVPFQNACPLPSGTTFNQGAMLPMAVVTTWAGLHYSTDLPTSPQYSEADKKGFLVWGGSSSVGSLALQIAKILGFKVYATASPKHHKYLKALGVREVFDYKDKNVVDNIVNAAKKDGVTIDRGYDAVGSYKECMEVLKAAKSGGVAKLASAPPLKEDNAKVEGVEAKFVEAPWDTEKRNEFFRFVFGTWLKQKLRSGELVPSPNVQVVQGGLKNIRKSLGVWKEGVSGVKFVLEL